MSPVLYKTKTKAFGLAFQGLCSFEMHLDLVFIGLDCHHKIPQAGWLRHRKLLLIVLEASSSRAGRQHGLVGGGLPSWRGDGHLHCVLALPFCVCVEGEEERERFLFFL